MKHETKEYEIIEPIKETEPKKQEKVISETKAEPECTCCTTTNKAKEEIINLLKIILQNQHIIYNQVAPVEEQPENEQNQPTA